MGLFGGTLFAAGIVVTPAQADWNIVSSRPFNEVSIAVRDLTTNDEFFDDVFSAPASVSETWNYANNAGSGLAETSLNHSFAELTIGPGSSGFANAYARIRAFIAVTVDTPTDILAEWDFGPDTITSRHLHVYEFGAGTVFYTNTAGSPGSQVITLLPGSDYGLAIQTGWESIQQSDYSFARITIIPAPSALAVLFLSAARQISRRRRRC